MCGCVCVRACTRVQGCFCDKIKMVQIKMIVRYDWSNPTSHSA